MSDCAINIRILCWHFQIKKNGTWSFPLNRYWLAPRVIIRPCAIYDWMPSLVGSK